MKKIITILLIIININSFSQDTIKTKQNKANNNKIVEQKLTKNELLDIKNDILTIKDEINSKSYEFEEKRTNLFTKYFELWGFIGLILSFFGLKKFTVEKIKKEVEDRVIIEVEKETKNKVGLLKEQLDEIERHKKYKTNSKIIVINKKGTNFPKYFEIVLKLFNIDINNPENRIDVENIVDITPKDIKKLKTAKLVLVENKTPSGVWDTKEFKDDYKDLANKICNKTTLLYFGDGRFPTDEIDEDKQHYISYTNASSQLYGNMLNLLKYKYELDNAQQ
jgi:hypothetical protein